MLLAVCGASQTETESLHRLIDDLCHTRGIVTKVRPIYHVQAFWDDFQPGRYQGVFLGIGDAAGFLAARRLREQDKRCGIVLIDDTDRYAIQSIRLHAADFVLRPYDRERLARSLDQLLRRTR